jgi:hypothetical protein
VRGYIIDNGTRFYHTSQSHSGLTLEGLPQWVVEQAVHDGLHVFGHGLPCTQVHSRLIHLIERQVAGLWHKQYKEIKVSQVCTVHFINAYCMVCYKQHNTQALHGVAVSQQHIREAVAL